MNLFYNEFSVVEEVVEVVLEEEEEEAEGGRDRVVYRVDVFH